MFFQHKGQCPPACMASPDVVPCSAGYVADLIVIPTALVLELTLEEKAVGLLILLRLWRLVRVAHGE